MSWRGHAPYDQLGSVVDGLKQPPSGLVELLGGLVVCQACGLGLEWGKGDTGLEEGLGMRLQGRHDQPLGVAFLHLALGLNRVLGKPAGAVEVEVGVEICGTESLRSGGLNFLSFHEPSSTVPLDKKRRLKSLLAVATPRRTCDLYSSRPADRPWAHGVGTAHPVREGSLAREPSPA